MADHTHTSDHSHSHTVEWDIASFYHKSWNIVKMQPTLWLFGLAVLVFSGSSFNSSGTSSGTSEETDEKEASFIQRTTTAVKNNLMLISYADSANTSVVLGAKDSTLAINGSDIAQSEFVAPEPVEEENPIGDSIALQFSQVPASVYMLLAIEVIAFVCFAIVIGIVAMNWAEASLYKAFESFAHGKKESISTISTRAAQYIIPAFKFNILFGLTCLGLGFLILLAIGFVAIIAGLSQSAPIGGIAAIAATIGVLYFFMKVIVAFAWGRLYLFLENTGAQRAMNRGMDLSKVKGIWWKTGKMSFVSVFASGIVSLLSLIPIGILVGIPLITMVVSKQFSFLSIPFFATALFVGFPFMTFMKSVMRAITFGAWYFAFQAVKGYRNN